MYFLNHGLINSLTHIHTNLQQFFCFHQLKNVWGRFFGICCVETYLGFKSGISGVFAFFHVRTFEIQMGPYRSSVQLLFSRR